MTEERDFILAHLENQDRVDPNTMISTIPYILENLTISPEDTKQLLTMFTTLMNDDEIDENLVINAIIHIFESEYVSLRVKEHLFTRLFNFSDNDDLIKAMLTVIKCTRPVLSLEAISKDIRARMFKLLEYLIGDDSKEVRDAAKDEKE